MARHEYTDDANEGYKKIFDIRMRASTRHPVPKHPVRFQYGTETVSESACRRKN
jgi:hypothetical protein